MKRHAFLTMTVVLGLGLLLGLVVAGTPSSPVSLAAPAGTTPTPGAPPAPGGEAGEDTAIPEEIANVPGVTEDWWAAVQQQIRGDLYSLSAVEAEGGDASYRAYNPDHGFDLTFAAGGVRLAPVAASLEGVDGRPSLDRRPSVDQEPAWTWELRTTGYGYEGDVRPLPALAETASDGNRLEYCRAGLTEWYANDERGLEQGFTLDAPPPGEGEVLAVEMVLDTELVPTLTGDPARAIEFTQPDGNVVLMRYSDLYAYDAQGAPLPARMALSGCGRGARPGSCRLQLLVEGAGARYPLRIDPLLTAPDWAALGENTGDEFGYSVSTAGDVNGDGFADLVVGAWGNDEGGLSNRGTVYVYHGSPAGPEDTPAWSRSGDAAEDQFGYSVSTAGDVNGDGYDDLVVGAPFNDQNGDHAGAAYVYHGSPAGLPTGTPHWVDFGEVAMDGFGWSVATAGDVNGDGYADVVVGALWYDELGLTNRGKAYVYHGGPAGLTTDSADWTAVGDNALDNFGYAVATAGDVNADGYGDLVVGAPLFDDNGAEDAGAVYVYYGTLTGLPTGGPDWTAVGESAHDQFGWSVATAGYVNGEDQPDDCADLVVGSWGWDTGRGKAYVYYGSQTGFIQDAPPDWTAAGALAEDHFGRTVATAGDVDGDGYDDLVVGAFAYDELGLSDRGKAYVYHGSESGLSAGDTPNWAALGENAGDFLGWSVATAGDVNGDGYADLVVGALRYDGRRGKAYVYQGTALGLTPSFDWTAGGEGSGDKFGYAVATAGDVDGDGYSDLAVGAHAYDGGRGKVYVYHGGPAGLSTGPPDWSAAGEQAGDAFGRSVGTAGDVNGDGYDDLVVGAPWNDGNGTNAGRTYVFHGSPTGLAGTPAWTASGVYVHDNLGAPVAAAGDVNCDGYADLVVGAVGYPQGKGNGQAYVYHGGPAGLTEGPADWTASGEHAADHFGYALTTAGDVNGDRCADLVAGAWGYDGNRGKAYVYHGSSLGLGSAPAFTASGESANDYLGWALGAAGDVDGDGYSDLAVGAWGYDDGGDGDAGRVDLYPGGSAGITTTGAISLTGEIAGEHFGYALGTAGDVNGDGYADLVVGAEGYQYALGKAYLFRGGSAGLIAGAAAWTATGARGGDHFGAAVGTAGDVDGDGYSDVVAGAWGHDDPANANAGSVYAYRGAASGPGTVPSWCETGETDSEQFGDPVVTAGDVNGDGYSDLVVGAWGYDGERGKAYVYHGSAQGLETAPAWTASGVASGDRFGLEVSTAGDVDGDGYNDIVVGASSCDLYGSCNSYAHVYHGSAEGLRTDPNWTATGSSIWENLGNAGDVNGDGYSDLFFSAYQRKTITFERIEVVVGSDGLCGDSEFRIDFNGAFVWEGHDMDDGDNRPIGVSRNFAGLSTISVWEVDSGEACAPDDSLGSFKVAATDLGPGSHQFVEPGGDNVVRVYWTVRKVSPRVYVYHGSPAGLNDIPTWTETGEEMGDSFGDSLGSAGDVNGDGYSDLIVGAPFSGTGTAYVYLGSRVGLERDPAWTATGENANDRFGYPVGTAGDVNGDGFADVVILATGYDGWRGRVYVYHGSAHGLDVPHATFSGGDEGEEDLGQISSVGRVGDVNGDGYADVVVGASRYMSATGRVYLYQGSPLGLKPIFEPVAAGENEGDTFGSSAATAGDVNGDGYADLVVSHYQTTTITFERIEVVVGSDGALCGQCEFRIDFDGAPVWEGQGMDDGDNRSIGVSRNFAGSSTISVWEVDSGDALCAGDDSLGSFEVTATDLGPGSHQFVEASGDNVVRVYWTVRQFMPRVYVYPGNNSGGRASLARQVRGDGSGQPVQPWGPAYTADSFGVSLQAVDPLGRGRGRLEVQACPPGVPFGDAACLSGTSENWIEVSSGGEVDLSLIVYGPPEGTLYRWRARALYDSPLYGHGPWRRLMGQAQEADVRVTRLPADLSLTKTMDPEGPLVGGEPPITYTLTFTSNGPARGVVISDLLSSEITGTQVISSGVAITDTGHVPCCVWAVQDLEANEGGVITITGQALAERFVNTAVISGTSPDPNPANNSATVQTHIPGVLFVDGGATGANNGLSWANAYNNLQDALAEAKAGDQIWVAEGVYRPVASGQRSSSIHLVSGVALHGGFAGTENWLHQRDPAAHPTVLSGDIGTVGNPDDNVYHVVTATVGMTTTTVLEGVTIAGGNANGNGDDGLGGGLYNEGGSPTLVNVAFIGNAADGGGGLYNEGGSPTLVNVAFSGNTAESEGGGIYNLSSSPVMTNVTLSRNEANLGGGAIHNEGDSAPTLANSILWGNTPGEISNALTTTVSYSDIEGGCPSGATCTEVLNGDPQLWNPEGEDGLAGTLDDDLRLYSTFRHPSPVIDQGDNDALPLDSWDLDGDGDTGERLPLDLSGRWRLVGFTGVTPTVDMGAYEATVVDVMAEGQALFDQGEAFRLENLQLLSSDTLADALKNYANFNDGEWYYAFCADYDEIDEHGYCPPTGPGDDATLRDNVRNTLLDAVDLYRVAVGWPTEVFSPVRGSEIPAWEGGSRGVLSATTEIANDHLIFGNEFLVDATDYRFSTAGIPYADQIIAQELDELAQARRQFELIMEQVFRAFNDWGVGAYCDSDQFEQFGVASSLLMSTLNETAARHYMLRDSEAALAVYEQADQFLQMVALDQMAEASGEDYLQDGSWEMLNNLSQMRERAQAISQGLDFFGFAPEYVPLQAYEQLLELTEGPTGNTGLLGTARDLEDQARDAQRTFDANASDMYTELDNLEVELDGQLFELCGESEDYTETCAGGLMEQNLDALDAASLRVGLAWHRAQNLAEQIRIEQDRAGQEIAVTLGVGRELSAYELAIGKLEAERTTTTAASSSEDEVHLGVDVTAEGYFEMKGWIPEWGFKAAITAKAGYQHAWTWIDTTQTVWDPTAEEIREYESLKALKQAEAQADIVGANSAAVIHNLLLQQSEALEEYEIAMAEFNTLAAEHNYLAQRRSRLLNKRDQAINRVASHNSHLLSPAYRIWRDSLTTQSMQAHALAAQFAYLTARAAEYELLTPYPDLGQIFRARTSNDIRLFLDGLKVWVQALDRPGQLNRYPYTLSLAQDLWGLTDQALDPDELLSEPDLDQARYEAFQQLLQSYLDGARLEFTFGTTLDQQGEAGQYLFSPNIWNNRIAGIGAPLAGSEGVAINIVTRQSDDVGDPEVVLIHGGWAGGAEAYRNAEGQIVYYDPDTAVPVGYLLPAALDPENTTAVLRPGINGAGAIPNSALLNLSVAAATWTFRIPAESRGSLDYSQIEDIEIVLDTTGRALPGRAAQAEQDALRLQAGLPMEPVEMEPAVSAPPRAAARTTQRVLAPSVPGEIGGSYFGSVMITSPITLTIQVLNLDLWNELGTLTGEVTGTVTSPFTRGLDLAGSTDNVTFQLTSEVFTSTVAGQVVTQVFALDGHAEDGGDILRAVYSGTLTNLLPDPIQVQGSYNASRPGAVGSERLVLRSAAQWVQPGASTAITATLYDESMAVITGTQTLTFTTDLGTVAPDVIPTADGEAVVTFWAGATQGQATVWATTGEITGSVRIQVSDLAAPLADFSASPVSGTLPLTVTFTDLSLNDPTGWTWDFGDGATSKAQHPSHAYVSTGTYTVTLAASNALDADTRSRSSYITVMEPQAPEAYFSANPTSGTAPLAVTFTDESAYDPTGWLWDFGDGGTSTDQHPQYTYYGPGTFTVTLTVFNAVGANTLTVPGYITVKAGATIYLPLVFRSTP